MSIQIKNRGIIILALKRDSYACGAFNLAMSIKSYNPAINITLITDNTHLRSFRVEHFAVFDNIKEMTFNDYNDNNGFSPGKAKLNIYKYSPYDKTIFIDADSIVLKDIAPLLDRLDGSAFKSNVIEGYTQWTDEETFKAFFNVATGTTINSSWFYWEDPEVFEIATAYYDKEFPLDKISPRWGISLPDEMFLNASLTGLGIDPKFDANVMFFGNEIVPETNTEIQDKFFALTLYGGQTTVRRTYIDFYDRLMFNHCNDKGIEHRFKADGILKGKHVQQK